jgi:hypothetical protein
VTVASNMTTTMKDQFFANRENKQQFIFMLSRELKANNWGGGGGGGGRVSPPCSKTVLVGDDTDLIVLLCYHAKLEYLFHPEPVVDYNGKLIDPLDSLRHTRFCDSKKSHGKPVVTTNLGSSKVPQPSCLPSSSRMERAWQECDEGFVSIQTSLLPAPEHLLKVIRCNYKSDCSTHA